MGAQRGPAAEAAGEGAAAARDDGREFAWFDAWFVGLSVSVGLDEVACWRGKCFEVGGLRG